MVTQAMIDHFFSQSVLAVAGVSRDRRKFGYRVFKDLKQKGYRVYALNPNAEQIGADPCYASLQTLPEPVGAVVMVVPPEITLQLIDDAIQTGVKQIWMQPGAESQAAIDRCHASGIAVIHGECIMMYAGQVKFPHSFHRWINQRLGKLPK